MSAAVSLLRKDAAPDAIVGVMVTGDGHLVKARPHSSLWSDHRGCLGDWTGGQVLDVEVLSKWSSVCQEKRKEYPDSSSTAFLDWWEEHQAFCTQNHYESSGSMETEGDEGLQRSVDKHKLRYTTMFADGVSSTFPSLEKAKPYGENHFVTKQECVGHVQKRMMSQLKAVKLKPHHLMAEK